MKKRLLKLPALSLLLVALLISTLYRGEISPSDLESLYASDSDGSRFAEIEGSRVHFRDQGPPDAPALLLLHGTAASLHTWDGWVDRLENNFRILRLDLQGYGLTGPNLDKDYSVDRQIRVITSLMDQRGIRSAAVAGNSLGGLIAWRFALAHPDRARSLVLLSPAGAPPAPNSPPADDSGGNSKKGSGFRMLDLAKIPGLRLLLTRLTPRFLIRRSLEQVYGDATRLEDSQVERYYLMLRRRGNRQALVDTLAQKKQPGSASARSKEPAPSAADVTQPTLILWGSKDRWIPVEHGSRFHQTMPNSRLIVYPDLGHVPMEEAPERTAADAETFLLSLTASLPQRFEPQSQN